MDQFYFEEGYLEPSYFTVIREAELAATVSSSLSAAVIIADATGYYISDYIEIDYFVGGGATVDASGAWSSLFTQTAQVTRIQEVQSSQSAEFTQTSLAGRQQSAVIDITSAFTPTLTVDAFKNHTAILEAVATMTSAGVVNRSANVLLDHIADLNAMAAKTVDPISTMATTATFSVTATKSVTASSAVQSNSSLSFNGGRRNLASAQFNTNSSVYAKPFLRGERPLQVYQIKDSVSIDTDTKYYGTGSLYNGGGGTLSYYVDNTFTGQLVVAEFWFKRLTTGSGLIYEVTTGSSGNGYKIRFDNTTGTTYRLIYQRVRNGISSNYLGSTFNLDTEWHFYTIYLNYTDNELRFFVDGIGRGGSGSTILGNPQPLENLNYFNLSNNLGTLAGYTDEFRIIAGSVGTIQALGYSASSVPGNTQPFVNNSSYTKFLGHFDVDYRDDVTEIEIASASLTASATLTAQANPNTKQAAAATTVTASISANVTKVVRAEVGATASAEFTVNNFRTRFADIAVATEFTVTAVVGSVKQFEISAGALFTPSIDVDAQLAGVALLESQFTHEATAVKTTDVISNIQAVASQSATGTVTLGLASALSSDTTLSSTMTKIQTVQSNLASEFAITINNSAIEQYDASLSSEFACTVVADRFARYNATLSSAFTQDTQAQRTRDLASALTSTTAIAATVIRQQQGTSELASAFTQTVNGVKDTDVVMAIAVTATQSTTAVKTVDAIPQLESIATQLTVAFQNATGTVLAESTATLSAIIGSRKEYVPNSNSGLRLPILAQPNTINQVTMFPNNIEEAGYPLGSIAIPQGYAYDANTISVWIRQEVVGQGSWQLDSLEYTVPYNYGRVVVAQGNITVDDFGFGGPITINWTNVVPSDVNWHHVFLKYQTQSGFYGDGYRLWVDGVDKGYREFQSNEAGIITFVQEYGCIVSGSGYSVAQLRIGNGQITVNDVYDNGYKDLGVNGRDAFDRLSIAGVYTTFDDPWANIVIGQDENPSALEYFQGSDIVIPVPDMQAHSRLVVGITTAVLSVSNQFVTTELVANIAVIRSAQSSLESNFAITAQGLGIFGITANFTSNASLTATPFRIKQFVCTLTAEATITAIVGPIEQFNSNLTSEFTLDADAVVKPPVRAEAFLLCTSTVTVDAASFTDTTTLMFSLGTLTADITVIPPIRIEADLVAETALTVIIGTIEQFAILTASAGTMTVNAVKTASAQGQITAQATVSCAPVKFTGIILTLTAFNTQLTLGDVINLDPALTYVIPQETREYPILPETRLYEIESETRELIILKG